MAKGGEAVAGAVQRCSDVLKLLLRDTIDLSIDRNALVRTPHSMCSRQR